MGTIWTSFRGCASLAPAVQCTRSLRRSGTGGGKTCRVEMMPDAWRIPASNEIQYITISYKYMCHVFFNIHRVSGEVTMPCCYNTGFYFSHASYQQHRAVCNSIWEHCYWLPGDFPRFLPQKVPGDWSVRYPATCSAFCTDHTEPSHAVRVSCRNSVALCTLCLCVILLKHIETLPLRHSFFGSCESQ